MNKDIRLNVSFWDHWKTVTLKAELGLEAIESLQRLWCFAAQNKPDGILSGMSLKAIELSAKWNGLPGLFVSKLVELIFLDFDGKTYSLHDWFDHNGFVAHAGERSARARINASAGWETRKRNASINDSGNAGINADCYAPSPSPTPSPTPSPKEEKPTSEVSQNPETTQLSKTIKPVSDAAVSLAELLRDQINARSPDGIPLVGPKTSMRSWAVHFQRMISIDNRSSPDIESVIKWSQADPFWGNNILSPAKLREKWAQLVLKMNGIRGGDNIDEWARRKEAELEAGRVQAIY